MTLNFAVANLIMPHLAGRIKLLIVDDHPIVRVGLRALFADHTHLVVVGEAGSPDEAVAAARQHQPDVILLDLNLGTESGLDVIDEFTLHAPEARVLVLTGVADIRAHTQAMRLGAAGLVLKEKATEVLVKAIEKIHAGDVWFDRVLMRQALAALAGTTEAMRAGQVAAKNEALTPREREIIQLIGEGLKNQQIADRLFISEKTVRHHLSSIFGKLGVTDRLELVIYAYRYDLIQLDR